MSRVIPSKFMPVEDKIGADSFKQITPERVRLHPVGVSSGQNFIPGGMSTLVFRVPCYSNSVLDTSRSFLSFNLKTSHNTLLFANGLPIFETMTVKTSSGLVIEQITGYDVLSKLLNLVSTEELYRSSEGLYGDVGDMPPVLATSLYAADGVQFTYQFNTGILSKHLKSYLPLFLADQGSGYAFDVELTLSPPSRIMKSTTTPPPNNANYILSNPVFNLCLLKMDNELCAKYKTSDELVLPYTTFHNHRSSVSSQSAVININESATNIKRVWSVFLDSTQTLTNENSLAFRGSCKDTVKIKKYNYKAGNQYLFNEPVADGIVNNNLSLMYVKNALYADTTKPLLVAKHDPTSFQTNYESASKNMFFTVANWTYSPESEKGVVQGLSTSTPIQFEIEFSGTPNFQVQNLVEIGYNMVIKNGVVTYRESRPGSHTVY